MATYHLKNWRDERGSEAERAKALVGSKNTSLTKLSKLTKIPYQTLANYRVSIDKLDKASWRRVNLLAQAYDILEIQDNMSQEDVESIQSILHSIFSDLRDDYDENLSVVQMITRMEQIITSDPVAVYELFKAYAQK